MHLNISNICMPLVSTLGAPVAFNRRPHVNPLNYIMQRWRDKCIKTGLDTFQGFASFVTYQIDWKKGRCIWFWLDCSYDIRNTKKYEPEF